MRFHAMCMGIVLQYVSAHPGLHGVGSGFGVQRSGFVKKTESAGGQRRIRASSSTSHLLSRSRDPMGKARILAEFWSFLRVRKKYWLAPIVVVLVLLSLLIVLTQGSALAPFIYALF